MIVRGALAGLRAALTARVAAVRAAAPVEGCLVLRMVIAAAVSWQSCCASGVR